MKLTVHLYLMLRLKMFGDILLSPFPFLHGASLKEECGQLSFFPLPLLSTVGRISISYYLSHDI
jgi:hypothetical protein